jgi:hypothetical protein
MQQYNNDRKRKSDDKVCLGWVLITALASKHGLAARCVLFALGNRWQSLPCLLFIALVRLMTDDL